MFQLHEREIKWKHKYLTPICEKRAEKESGNYKWADLPLAVGKISKTVIRNEVTKHPERDELIKLNQASFTKGKSFLTNLVAFLRGTEARKSTWLELEIEFEVKQQKGTDDTNGDEVLFNFPKEATRVTLNPKPTDFITIFMLVISTSRTDRLACFVVTLLPQLCVISKSIYI